MKNRDISRLRQERERRGWSRNYVAERVQVDVITVGRWERGERLPHPLYRQELCNLFEMSAEELGLFSALPPQQSAETTVIADISPKVQVTINEEADVSLQEPLPDTATAVTSLATPMSLIEKKKTTTKTTARRLRRRMFLAGLAGLGAMTLVETGFLFMPRTSHPAIAPPLILRQPSRQLLDENASNWINRLAWSPDGSAIAAANGMNHISIWDIEAGMFMYNYPTLNLWVNDISWSKRSGIAAANADYVSGSIQVWSYPKKTPSATFRRPYPLRTVSWSPDGAYLAFAGHATTVEVWEPFTPRMISRYVYPALGSLGINRVRWSATGSLLVCATDDGTVHVLEALTGKLEFIYRGHHGRVMDLVWSPDGRYIASSGIDKTVRVWEALTGQTRLVYQGQRGNVDGVDWSLQGKYIASGGADHTAQVWEALTGRLVAKYEGFSGTVETVLWSVDGKTIAMGTSSQGIELWPAPQQR